MEIAKEDFSSLFMFFHEGWEIWICNGEVIANDDDIDVVDLLQYVMDIQPFTFSWLDMEDFLEYNRAVEWRRAIHNGMPIEECFDILTPKERWTLDAALAHQVGALREKLELAKQL